jgi:hypothetical protein
MNDAALSSVLGQALYETISKNNSEEAVVGHYLNWLKK